jgi:conjugative transposon TraN protein
MNQFIRIFLAGFLLFIGKDLSAQSDDQHIEVTFNKTSSVVFAANITSVDRGSRDVLAQKAKGVNNILQLKAGRPNFRETNLTVITADGKLHHFFIRYAEQPSTYTIQAHGQASETPPLLFQSEMTDAELQLNAKQVRSTEVKTRLKHDAKFDMSLSLQGIYIEGNIMFYHLRISNTSNIPYHPDVLRFYVKDKKKAKRTASQEVTEEPIYIYGNSEVINGQSSVDLVYAIPKFTIPDAKLLNIELMERHGGRHLKLEIKNRMIVKAHPVPAE